MAVGTYELTLPSGLLLLLNNCYYVPALSRNIISVSCLDNEGFTFLIKNKKCSIQYEDMLYCTADSYDGLYILNLEKPNNDNIYNINNKKSKPNDINQTYLWHCRLGHINEKRISKLHQDGLLETLDFESFDIYSSCLLRKMTKTPFT